jgi:hypothetical protein
MLEDKSEIAPAEALCERGEHFQWTGVNRTEVPYYSALFICRRTSEIRESKITVGGSAWLCAYTLHISSTRVSRPGTYLKLTNPKSTTNSCGNVIHDYISQLLDHLRFPGPAQWAYRDCDTNN